jgi:hypothetical protein
MRRLLVPLLLIALAGAACRGTSAGPTREESSATPPVAAPTIAPPLIDAQRALTRYERTLPQTTALIREQPWYQDGLDPDEEIFVDRLLTYLSRSPGATVGLSQELIPEETIRDKLFLLDTVQLRRGPTKILIVYWPKDDAQQEMRVLKTGLPVLEQVMRTPFPVPLASYFNGPHRVNQLDDPYFIRIANSNATDPHILFHESAHIYWHQNVPNWFAEGMADLLAAYVRDRVSADPPDWWRDRAGASERLYQANVRAIQSGRYPERPLAARPQSQGEVYIYSMVMLTDVRHALGDDRFFEAAADLYTQTGGVRLMFGDDIARTFAAHATPAERQEVAQRFHKEFGDE